MGFLLHSWVIFLVRFQYSYPSLLKLENVLEKSQQKLFSHVRTQNVLRSFIWNIIQTSSTRRARHVLGSRCSMFIVQIFQVTKDTSTELSSNLQAILHYINLISCQNTHSGTANLSRLIQRFSMLNRAGLSFHLEDPSLLTIFLHSALNTKLTKPINTFLSQ